MAVAIGLSSMQLAPVGSTEGEADAGRLLWATSEHQRPAAVHHLHALRAPRAGKELMT